MPVSHDLNRLEKKLAAAGKVAESELDRVLLLGGQLIAGEAQKNVSGGGSSMTSLNVRKGRLKQSIVAKKLRRGAVRVGTNVIYARIHEYGGVIRPVRAKALRFRTRDGTWVTTKKVVMPARPYLIPALDKRIDEVRAMVARVYDKPLETIR